MNLLPDDEQNEIIAQSAAFLASEMPVARLRELIEAGEAVDDSVWRASAELGWLALGLPESEGGIGATLGDEMLLFRELGRGLTPGPYLATSLAARVAGAGGDPELAGSLIGGDCRVGLVVPGQGCRLEADRLRGPLRVMDAAGAELALVVNREAAALVRIGELGKTVAETCIDEATPLLAAAEVDAPLAVRLESREIWTRGIVLSAAMLVGIAEACRDIGAEHARSRVQFDRPIGVNQAIKHPCADMAIRAEAALCQTVMAAVLVDEGRADAELQAHSARVVAADAAERNAAATVQILGGMGFTFEHDAHLYVKRVQVLARMLSGTKGLLRAILEA